ncbi:DUF6397 family protein [Streptomyces sp. CRN 30]|uniref:DUF6397 family protein n=1 Tax=Streptomyces sp. CRN 30 TaxID=3075613 RepID=UPI0039C260CF
MSHDITTHENPPAPTRRVASSDSSLAPGRAARELGLKRSEYDIAVGLGRIRTVPDYGGGGRRVTRAEIERLIAREGYPESLRRSVKAVGTAEGAALMQVSKARFTRLARLGLLVPVKVYVNRYRAVVWLYLAEELRQFASDEKNAALLKGRAPERMREELADGEDRRARNWRERRLGSLLRQADDPWARAAAAASLLDPVDLSAVVRDPYERSRLHRFRPAPALHGAPGSPTAELAQEIGTATAADEIDWLRTEVVRLVDAAREHSPAPRPEHRAGTRPAPRPVPSPSLTPDPVPRALLRRRNGRPHASSPAAVRPTCTAPSRVSAHSPAPSPVPTHLLASSPVPAHPTAPAPAPAPVAASVSPPPSPALTTASARRPPRSGERPRPRRLLGRLRRRSRTSAD